MTNTAEYHHIVIIGGGTAGITVAARLHRARKGLDMAIIEPSESHFYQPLWTLVGGGVYSKEKSMRAEADCIPPDVLWIKDSASAIDPEKNWVETASGRTIVYDYLIVAPGLKLNWNKIKGVEDALGKDGVSSNYSYDIVDKTWEFIHNFKGGTAIFTQPLPPVKCGGAPQKIAYLADEAFRHTGVRDKSEILFVSASDSIFQVPAYATELEHVVQRKGIKTKFNLNLVEIKPANKEAVFQRLDSGELETLHYDLLHVTPPMGPPSFLIGSPISDKDGWVEVDRLTLQHKRFPNIFSLGDASSLPTSKTGAAIRKQAPVVVSNLLAVIDEKPLTANYNGYTCCPLVTGYKSLILAEFDYDKKRCETFPIDQSKEHYSMYLLKKYVLPEFYWNIMLKGI